MYVIISQIEQSHFFFYHLQHKLWFWGEWTNRWMDEKLTDAGHIGGIPQHLTLSLQPYCLLSRVQRWRGGRQKTHFGEKCMCSSSKLPYSGQLTTEMNMNTWKKTLQWQARWNRWVNTVVYGSLQLWALHRPITNVTDAQKLGTVLICATESDGCRAFMSWAHTTSFCNVRMMSITPVKVNKNFLKKYSHFWAVFARCEMCDVHKRFWFWCCFPAT